MADVFGLFDPQALVVLMVALIGAVPVALYYEKTDKWFVAAYGFLLFAAVVTNLENVLLGDVLNFLEHSVGNLGAGVAFAVAAYRYRIRRVAGQADPEASAGE